jgi:hypothetical protein
MKDSAVTSTNELTKEARTTESSTAPKPIGNVTAKNGSTAIGNIQVGGDLSGNIVIGNNNSINDKK